LEGFLNLLVAWKVFKRNGDSREPFPIFALIRRESEKKSIAGRTCTIASLEIIFLRENRWISVMEGEGAILFFMPRAQEGQGENVAGFDGRCMRRGGELHEHARNVTA
jgi:hypothetical protein